MLFFLISMSHLLSSILWRVESIESAVELNFVAFAPTFSSLYFSSCTGLVYNVRPWVPEYFIQVFLPTPKNMCTREVSLHAQFYTSLFLFLLTTTLVLVSLWTWAGSCDHAWVLGNASGPQGGETSQCCQWN